MLARVARVPFAGLRPRVAAALVPRRQLSAPPSTIFDDSHLFPDHVLEEEKTGYPVGLPQIKEEKLWEPGAEETLVRPAAPSSDAAPPIPPRLPYSLPTWAVLCVCVCGSSLSVRNSGGMMALQSPSGSSTAAALVVPMVAARGL